MCLTYLLSMDHSLNCNMLLTHFPFARYLACYWHSYAVEAEPIDDKLKQLIFAFYKGPSHAFVLSTCLDIYPYRSTYYPSARAKYMSYADAMLFAMSNGIEYGALAIRPANLVRWTVNRQLNWRSSMDIAGHLEFCLITTRATTGQTMINIFPQP
jgi:hypothetical protein